MSPLVMLGVALAGGFGAACRYVLDFTIGQTMRGVLPWGTWFVNITGSCAMGLLIGVALAIEIPMEFTLIVGGGFLGAYTTFSTWMYESLRLIEQGAWRIATVNLIGSVVTGILAAALGVYAAGLIL